MAALGVAPSRSSAVSPTVYKKTVEFVDMVDKRGINVGNQAAAHKASGVILDAFLTSGKAALHVAAEEGNLNVIRSLIQAGADKDVRDSRDW